MKRTLLMAVALTAALAAPQQASARGVPAPSLWGTTTCGGSTLQSCVEFELVQTGSTYQFSVTYLSSLADDTGVVTGVSLYDLAGNPNYNFSNITLVSAPAGTDWTAFDGQACHTTGDGVGNSLFEACASADAPRPQNGLQVGETVVFSFTSNYAITASSMTATGGVGARAHIQSFGSEDCSFKLDSRTGEFGDTAVDSCEPTTVVPEPATMFLLASGLIGVVGVAHRRRKKDAQVD